MRLFLLRHGNTFGPADKVVRAGSSTDYPLVERGREQAYECATFLRQQSVEPQRIYCSPLLRTREFAEIIGQQLDGTCDVLPDERLTELDYGPWSGLADDEIQDQYDADELEAWNRRSVWPASGVFGSNEDCVAEEALSFLDDIIRKHDNSEDIVAVSSNGKLRYFLRAIAGEFESRKEAELLKVKTGHISLLCYQSDQWQLEYWNKAP